MGAIAGAAKIPGERNSTTTIEIGEPLTVESYSAPGILVPGNISTLTESNSVSNTTPDNKFVVPGVVVQWVNSCVKFCD